MHTNILMITKSNKLRQEIKETSEFCTNQRVDTYSVYGGCEETSRARPKSASLMTSFVHNKFSAELP